MGTRTSYAPGTPSWVDVQAADIGAARDFYSDLFGWSAEVSPQPDAGGYTMFTIDGVNVAGGGPVMGDGMPDAWTVYMTVQDVDATAAKVADAGGVLLAGPFDVFDSGRTAVFADNQGTPFAVWQPNQHIGAGRVNDVGCFCWNELASTDIEATKAFYRAVFGWEPSEASGEGTAFSIDGRMTCGSHPAGEGEPPFWSVWFTVEDCDAATDHVTSKGGQVLMAPSDMGFGRGSMVAAPGGAVFGLAAMDDPDE